MYIHEHEAIQKTYFWKQYYRDAFGAPKMTLKRKAHGHLFSPGRHHFISGINGVLREFWTQN